MPKLKICGLKRREDIEYVNECLPNYIGFVLAADSKRCVNRESAALLKKTLDKRITAVGVFVNERLEEVASVCNEGIIDIVQLHGDEGVEYILKLKTLIKAPIIKAFRLGGSSARNFNGFSTEEASASPADFPLFDTFTKGERGGSGRPFDHTLIKDIKRPYFLAGGLNEHNLPSVLQDLEPYCVDVSSGAETDGVKDLEKIRALKRITSE